MPKSLIPTAFISFLTFALLTTPSSSSLQSFIFAGCSQQKYTASPYESNLNSLLTYLLNSATFTNYNNFTVLSPSSSHNTLYGLYQCRGDLSNSDCARCVAAAAAQLRSLYPGSCGGALQLEGCFVKYDNATFLGVEDKAVVLKKCGPPVGLDSGALTRSDAVLSYLGGGDGSYRPYRVAESGDFYGVAQCVQDLSPGECRDCLSEAASRLKTECGPVASGDMYLGKCYVRFSERGDHSHGGHDKKNGDETQKTLALLIGAFVGIVLLIAFLSYLSKLCGKRKGGK